MSDQLIRDIEDAQLCLPWLSLEMDLTPAEFRRMLTEMTRQDPRAMSVDDAFSKRPRRKIPSWLVVRLLSMPTVGDWAPDVYEAWAVDAQIGDPIDDSERRWVADTRQALATRSDDKSVTSIRTSPKAPPSGDALELSPTEPTRPIAPTQPYTVAPPTQPINDVVPTRPNTATPRFEPGPPAEGLPPTIGSEQGDDHWLKSILSADEATVASLHADDPRELGEFRLIGRVGVGGMGCVYLASSDRAGLACLKMMRAELSASATLRERFDREADFIAKGASKLELVGRSSDIDLPWFAYRYVPGVSLARAYEIAGAMDRASLLMVAHEVFQGLRDLHAAHVIHRDLKPGNIIVGPHGVVIIDFGIGKDLLGTAPSLTLDGQVLGTVGYMSPEQVLGDAVGSSSDIYSAAMVLAHSLVGGRVHWDETSQGRQLVDVVTRGPNLAALPPWFLTVFGDCLERRPDHRPAASHLAARLGRLCAASTTTDALRFLPRSRRE